MTGAVVALGALLATSSSWPRSTGTDPSVRADTADGRLAAGVPAALDAGPQPSSLQETRPDRSLGSNAQIAAPGGASGDVGFGPGLEEAPVPLVWELEDESSHTLDHPVGDYHPTRHGLRLDRDRIHALEVGDSFAIPLPGLGEIEATVSWVNQAENGDRGVGAVIDGSDDAYALTLTLGERALFGQVSTADGRFLVEGIGATAAVFRDDLEQVLVDPSRTDERIPPEVSP